MFALQLPLAFNTYTCWKEFGEEASNSGELEHRSIDTSQMPEGWQ
jgi:hypothetical protein